MARPLRIEYSGASYHVMNRGNHHQPTFEDVTDYASFLEKLAKFTDTFGVHVRCFCLMPNHFHLYINTPSGNLSRFMQSLLTSYTISFNRRHRTSGHLFQGRFKALLVEDEGYGSEVSRYIHLNPVQVKGISDLEIAEKIGYMREFRWSSYRYLIGLHRCPEWLDRNSVLKRWGKRRRDQYKAYSTYVERGLLREISDPFESAAARSVLGSESFVERMRRGLLSMSEKKEISTESASGRQLVGWVKFEKLVKAVSECYGVETDRLFQRHSRDNEGRQVLLYLSKKYCRGRYTLSELASMLNLGSVGGFTSSCTIIGKRIAKDKILRKRVEGLERSLE